MKNSVLIRKITVETKNGKIEIASKRFASFSNKKICAISYKVTPLDKDVKITMVPYLDFNVKNEDSNYKEVFWDINKEECHANGGYVEASTKDNTFNDNKFTVGAAMRIYPLTDAININANYTSGYVDQEIIFDAKKGKTVGVEKIIAINISSDKDVKIKDSTINTLEIEAEKGFDVLLFEHQEIFSKIMNDCDVEIVGDAKAQQGIRFNMFQLLSTYDGQNSKLNIGPKGLTGEKYGGAAYWDTEAFLIPFYLGIYDKSVARNLLMFRYNTLNKAIKNASKLGLKGALYPMVTFDGTECHNEWEITFEEIHRNGAMAYAIHNYVNYTGDYNYLFKYGFEVLISIARFWEARVHYNNEKNCYMIHGVTGPNEYENNVNNNWYTNYIAKWCLEYTVEVRLLFQKELKKQV